MLNIHSIILDSKVNGPGSRMTIWTQGCQKGCHGCFNPETWSRIKGTEWDTLSLSDHVLDHNPEGLTLTGGDPFEQSEALLDFLIEIHDQNGDLPNFPRGIICFTGYTLEEIQNFEGSEGVAMRACLDYIDLLIDGRFEEDKRISHALAGSSNQRFHFSSKPGRGRSRIPEEEILIDQEVEIHIDSIRGSLHATGFPAINRKYLKKLGLEIIT